MKGRAEGTAGLDVSLVDHSIGLTGFQGKTGTAGGAGLFGSLDFADYSVNARVSQEHDLMGTNDTYIRVQVKSVDKATQRIRIWTADLKSSSGDPTSREKSLSENFNINIDAIGQALNAGLTGVLGGATDIPPLPEIKSELLNTMTDVIPYGTVAY